MQSEDIGGLHIINYKSISKFLPKFFKKRHQTCTLVLSTMLDFGNLETVSFIFLVCRLPVT